MRRGSRRVKESDEAAGPGHGRPPRPPKEDTRYRPGRAAAAYWVLLVSTGGRFVAEVARAWVDAPALGWVVVLGGLGQIVGLAIYFWTVWPRIRPVGSHLREAKGERF